MLNDKARVILSILTLLLLVMVGMNVRGIDEGILFDEQVMEYIHSRTTPFGICIMKGITYLGSAHFLIPLAILMLLIMIRNNNINAIILLLLSLLGSFILNSSLKSIFIRTRPLGYFLIDQGGYSFPSGHSMVSMTFYTTMAHLLDRRREFKRKNKCLWFVNFMLIASIGFSRIYLGVHWPTDVLMGYLLGYLLHIILVSVDLNSLL